MDEQTTLPASLLLHFPFFTTSFSPPAIQWREEPRISIAYAALTYALQSGCNIDPDFNFTFFSSEVLNHGLVNNGQEYTLKGVSEVVLQSCLHSLCAS